MAVMRPGRLCLASDGNRRQGSVQRALNVQSCRKGPVSNKIQMGWAGEHEDLKESGVLGYLILTIGWSWKPGNTIIRVSTTRRDVLC